MLTSKYVPKRRCFSTVNVGVKTRQKVSKEAKFHQQQRARIDRMFVKLKLKNLEEWNKFNNYRYLQTSTLISYYGDMANLLCTLYPNFPWNRNSLPQKQFNTERNLKNSLENQRAMIKILFHKLELQYMHELRTTPHHKFWKNGGRVLLRLYEDDRMKLLMTIFPNYPWLNTFNLVNTSEEYFASLDNQRTFMDNEFRTLKLQSLNEWTNVRRGKLNQIPGFTTLLNLYSNDMKLLLLNIYPNHSWRFTSLPSQYNFSTVENQRIFMNFMFKKLRLHSVDDWLTISKHKFSEHGGKKLLQMYDDDDMSQLLQHMYPLHDWQFERMEKPSKFYKSLINQRKAMEDLFQILDLRSLEDWIQVPKSYFIDHRKNKLLLVYNNDLQKLLSNVYPHHTWDFAKLRYFHDHNIPSITIQRKWMQKLYEQFDLTSLDDWYLLPKARFLENGGKRLHRIYSHSYQSLLTSIYPNYPWKFQDKIRYTYQYFKDWNHQRSFMNKLFTKLNLKNFDDWLSISEIRSTFRKYKGSVLLSLYGSFTSLLSTVYPNYPRFNFKYHRHYRIYRYFQERYDVRQKRDWYRIPHFEVNIHKTLKVICPNERWNVELLHQRNKKSRQRLLLVATMKIHRNHLILENYKHPHVLFLNDISRLEYDIFLPALNLAIEYQGEQHFNDNPEFFNFLHAYQRCDELKVSLSNDFFISLVHIPFWWDLSVSSLQFEITSSLFQTFEKKLLS